MRRRKKSKAMEDQRPATSEDSIENSGRGRSTKADALSRSPPQQRKRSLLGLSSMRDLVEQVQDSLTYKTKQQDSAATAASALVGGGNIHSFVDKSSGRGASAGSGLSVPTSPTSLAAGADPAEIRATSTSTAIAAPKKKVLDLKLLPSGTSLTLRTKKQAQFTPSPSEFKARERPDAVEHQPFCGVCAAPFTLMLRRQRCQVCGESVCAQCSSDKRYVEGQKGLQRVCDICIVEGPVVLDDNGVFAAGPSPVATSIIPPYPAPRSASSAYDSDSAGRHAPDPSSKASVLTNSSVAATSSKPHGGKDSRDHSAAVQMKFAEDDASPESTTTHSCTAGGGGTGSKTPSGGGNCSRDSVRPSKSPAARGEHICTPPRGNGSNSSGGKGTYKAAAEADTARDSTVTAPGEDDDGNAEGGPTSSATSSKTRKRSKKARRPGTAATGSAKPFSGKKYLFWAAGQSSGSGDGLNTPLSRSRSTLRSTNGGGSSNSTSVGSLGHGGSAVGDGCSTGNNDTSGTAVGGGSKGKWESISKKRPTEGGKGQVDVGNRSAFVRDFIRGAGIYRLNPRRLAGPLALCASRTGLDKIFGVFWTLLLWLLEVEGDSARAGGGGARSRRNGGGRGGHGHYYSNAYNNQCNGQAGGRGWRRGRRFLFLASLFLLASYRRYQVTHPELTTEHVLGAGSSLLLTLVSFIAHAVTDLVRDACGVVIPSLCGTRESRLAAAISRSSSDGIRSPGEVIAGIQFEVSGGGGSDGEVGGGGGRGSEVSNGGGSDRGGDTGDAAEVVIGTKDRIKGGHELDQYFFL